MIGLGCNLPQDAIYPTTMFDATKGQPLEGANRYVLHLPSGQLPPVNAFWSVTLVRRGFLPREQSDQPLCGELVRQPEEESRRLTRHLRSKGFTGAEKVSELAPGAIGQVRVDDAPLLAEGRAQSVVRGAMPGVQKVP